MNRLRAAFACITFAAFVGCSHAGSSTGLSMMPNRAPVAVDAFSGAMPIQHVIVIVQENRTVDNLFQGFNGKYHEGLDLQSWGYDSKGHRVPLVPVPFEAPYDNIHEHALRLGRPGGFVTEFNGGKMNGWDLEAHRCALPEQGWFGPCPIPHWTAYGFVPQWETTQYFQLAHDFVIADHVRQMNEGPSFIAHQYLIAGQSGGFTGPWAESSQPNTETTSGCNRAGSYVRQIKIGSPYPGIQGNPRFPCEDYRPYLTILEAMDRKYPADSNDWAYDAPGVGFVSATWIAPWGVRTIYDDPLQYRKVHQPETTIFTQLSNPPGRDGLAKLTYVVPCMINSDHATSLNAAGPRWVASVVNAVAKSRYWKSTAILVTWDDWGGWFDHYPPIHPAFHKQQYGSDDPYEYGFRVPLLVISPWIKNPGTVDHTVRTQASILSFTEWVFGLSSLKTLDQYSDNLSTLFDFTRKPIRYKPIDTHHFDTNDCAQSSAAENEPVDD